MAQRVGAGKCRHIEVKWMLLQQATRSDRVKHCRRLDEGADERQSMETDEPDGNEIGFWGGVSCAAANGENHGDVDS